MDPAVETFTRLVRSPEADLDLARGALMIAAIEHPGIEPGPSLRRLDQLARDSGALAPGDPLKALHRLREFLFEEEGYAGNAADYYDPRNSCLNDVLARRLGIPITLSVLVMEVGRRVGLRIAGIGLPGHFVVRADVGGEPVLLDPFDAGALLTHEHAAALVARATGRKVRLTDEHLAPVSKRQILTRMLMNLRGVYCQREAWDQALAVLDRLVALDTESVGHLRDRGSVLARLGHLTRALGDWERYLVAQPEASDADSVRHHLRRVRQRLAALN
jgi:regulator of sirC expression with transglutaminase-like and TPR domain